MYTLAMPPSPAGTEGDARPRGGGAARVVLIVYLAVAGAFILSSAWQITWAVFGPGPK